MRARTETNSERTNICVRTDIKLAMDALRMRRCREAGCYVSLGHLFGEAALMMLEREGVDVKAYEQQLQPMTMPERKPLKSAGRRRAARIAV